MVQKVGVMLLQKSFEMDLNLNVSTFCAKFYLFYILFYFILFFFNDSRAFYFPKWCLNLIFSGYDAVMRA